MVHTSYDYIVMVSSLLVLLPLLLQFIKRTKSANNLNLPPSPPKLPFIGNLHQLGVLPHVSFRTLSRKYGPIMLLHLGQVPTVVISSPELAKQVMKNHDLIFANRSFSKIAKLLYRGISDISFAPYGEYWRQAKKLCITSLLSAKMVHSLRHLREEEVELMMHKINQLSSSNDHCVVNLSEILSSFSSNLIARVVSNKFSSSEEKKHMLQKLSKENSDLLGAFHFADFFPLLGWFDAVMNWRARKTAKKWNDVLDEAIKERRNKDSEAYKHADFLDVLQSLENRSNVDYPFTLEEIKSILIDMFAAGIDTSFAVLEITMAELIRNVRVMEKVQAEVRGVVEGKDILRNEDLSKISYLKAVVKEVLRLHPPVPLLIPRESTEMCQLAGYHIPKKMKVFVNVWAIGRDPDVWGLDADEFKPERFVGSSVDFRGNDFSFIPFGAGRRICPGINLAMQTIELAVANLVLKFDWAMPSNMTRSAVDMKEKFGLVTSLKQRLHLVAKCI